MENDNIPATETKPSSIKAAPALPDVFMKRCSCGAIQNYKNKGHKKDLENFREALITKEKCKVCKDRIRARKKMRSKLEKLGRKTSRRFYSKQRDK